MKRFRKQIEIIIEPGDDFDEDNLEDGLVEFIIQKSLIEDRKDNYRVAEVSIIDPKPSSGSSIKFIKSAICLMLGGLIAYGVLSFIFNESNITQWHDGQRTLMVLLALAFFAYLEVRFKLARYTIW